MLEVGNGENEKIECWKVTPTITKRKFLEYGFLSHYLTEPASSHLIKWSSR